MGEFYRIIWVERDSYGIRAEYSEDVDTRADAVKRADYLDSWDNVRNITVERLSRHSASGQEWHRVEEWVDWRSEKKI